MRVERVVDPGALVHVEGESERRAARTNDFLIANQFFTRRAVLLCDVLADVLPVRRHLRIELERLEMNIGWRFLADALERLLQRFQPDYAPGTGDIGHEVNLEVSGHGIPERLQWVQG